jgi:predicted AAA+ superfamily ATPase
MDFHFLLSPYNPWWSDSQESYFSDLPGFHRPVFSTLMKDLRDIPQMISITGPRRIGKSTLLQQMIQSLLKDGVKPERIIYYSFDDPALVTQHVKMDELMDALMKEALKQRQGESTYLFLDEIQRLERWELFLKKYYDLKYPVRTVISGSASSPIFKKSRESLLGRIKDYHLLPFSFREYVLYHLQKEKKLYEEVEVVGNLGRIMQDILTEAPDVETRETGIVNPSSALQAKLDQLISQFFLEGGFPEVWRLSSWVAKQDYLYDNQIKKVIYEDLVLAAEFRKPELLKQFYLSLLEIPGTETNIQSIAHDTGINASQIDKYLPLLEMTDLVYCVSKFRSGLLKIRKGMMKFYLVDLALRNAALRLTDTLLGDNRMLGLYAENLVFLALKKWRGTLQMDYYRERHGEVDFVVHTGPRQFLPVEVKYQNQINERDFQVLERFVAHYPKSAQPLMVTKKWADFGKHGNAFCVPLALFLLLFD